MPVTIEDAQRLIAEAGLPLCAEDEDTLIAGRAQLCCALMVLCHNNHPGLPALCWDTPLRELYLPTPFYQEFAEDHVENACYEFGLDWRGDEGIRTFGELVLYIETRLRKLWSPCSGWCDTQAAFYEMRRIIETLRGSEAKPLRLRPDTRLDDCIPAAKISQLETSLAKQFATRNAPVEIRVFGRMEFGATWLALWFISILCQVPLVADGRYSPHWMWAGPLISGIAVALGLRAISRPSWRSVKTVGDLTRWALNERAQVIARIDKAISLCS